MDKLSALKKTKNLLLRRMENIQESIIYNSIDNNDLIINMIYQSNNEETSFNYFKIKKNQKSKILIQEEFKRIICLKGKLKIYIPSFNEDYILVSPNTQLIPPNTHYIIESLEDCEIISIFKPVKNNSRYKISESKTIYKKK